MPCSIIHGDCLEVMKTYPDNHFSGIVTDSPYGISFMSKGWDKQIPSSEYWSEMLRVCKPGSFILAAGLPRMIHRLTCVIEDSGWVIKDMIMYLFGSGFPKSYNFGRKMSDEWHGYGTALKPAWEGWIIAMKPLDGTFAQNAEKWGVAGLNIDSSRIPTLTGERPSDIISENEVIWEQERCLCSSCADIAVLNLKQETPEIREYFATNHVAQILREKGNLPLKDVNTAVIGCFTGPFQGGTRRKPNRRHKFEHIKIWEDHFGPKPEGFVIHHINGDGFDNRIENLQLMQPGDHIRLHKSKYKDHEERKAEYARRRRESRKMAK